MIYYTIGDNDAQYAERLKSQRDQRELQLLNERNSPIKDSHSFKGLSFFPPNMAFITEAKATPITSKKMAMLATSDGSKRLYQHFATLDFELQGKPQQLILLQDSKDPTEFFLPFNDLTNGHDTYGAGRYLEVKAKDIKPEGAFKLRLDFNLAYNPYCAYNPDFSCPIPPKENTLNLKVEAGEKYKQKK